MWNQTTTDYWLQYSLMMFRIKWQILVVPIKICSVTISGVEEVYVTLAVLLTLTMQKRGRPERDYNHDLSDAGAVLHQLSSQNNLELVVMWVDRKPLDDGHRSIDMRWIQESQQCI